LAIKALNRPFFCVSGTGRAQAGTTTRSPTALRGTHTCANSKGEAYRRARHEADFRGDGGELRDDGDRERSHSGRRVGAHHLHAPGYALRHVDLEGLQRVVDRRHGEGRLHHPLHCLGRVRRSVHLRRAPACNPRVSSVRTFTRVGFWMGGEPTLRKRKTAAGRTRLTRRHGEGVVAGLQHGQLHERRAALHLRLRIQLAQVRRHVRATEVDLHRCGARVLRHAHHVGGGPPGRRWRRRWMRRRRWRWRR
jgi:hypothetical protein